MWEVALLSWRSKFEHVENAKAIGSNVSTFELVINKWKILSTVGCYFRPSDKQGGAQRLVEQVLQDKHVGSVCLIISDLNPNLSTPT